MTGGLSPHPSLHLHLLLWLAFHEKVFGQQGHIVEYEDIAHGLTIENTVENVNNDKIQKQICKGHTGRVCGEE